MFITRMLMFYVRRRRIPGKLDIGKHQLVKPVTARMKAACLLKLIEERRNLSLLEKPYLSQAEEDCSELAATRRREDFMTLKNAKISDKMLKHRFADEHLNHLNVARKWE